jgi:hypothetical protein
VQIRRRDGAQVDPEDLARQFSPLGVLELIWGR